MGMADRSRHRVATFGRSELADYRAERVHAAYPKRMSMSVRWAGGELPLQTRFIGEHFWLPAAAAVATALELGVDPALVAERVADFEPLTTRCGVMEIPGRPDVLHRHHESAAPFAAACLRPSRRRDSAAQTRGRRPYLRLCRQVGPHLPQRLQGGPGRIRSGRFRRRDGASCESPAGRPRPGPLQRVPERPRRRRPHQGDGAAWRGHPAQRLDQSAPGTHRDRHAIRREMLGTELRSAHRLLHLQPV